jgi:electron transfer flavoprotein beta subunit
MLAERLQMPHSTIIMEVQVDPSTHSTTSGSTSAVQAGGLRVKRELEGGWFQWIAMPLPALLTIQSGINQLRYATLKGIMAAKKKEIRKAPLPAGLTPSQQIVSLALPTRSKQTHMIDGTPSEAAKDLVRRLREEARAL